MPAVCPRVSRHVRHQYLCHQTSAQMGTHTGILYTGSSHDSYASYTNQSFQNNYFNSTCISYYKFWNMILLKHKILNAQILRERDPYIKVFLNDTKYMSLSVLNAVCCLKKFHPKVHNHGEGPWLKAATTAFTFKTLLRHYAKWALTPRSLNVKLGPRRKGHKGRAVWLA